MSPTIVSAVNDTAVLESCLLRSPGLNSCEILLERGHPSAAKAYNRAIEHATRDVILLAHQDLFLPPGWAESLEVALKWLDKADPNWGVLGVFGVDAKGVHRGWVYSSGLASVLGMQFDEPQQVRTLDEVLLVIRKSSDLRFDESLRGFHMYGTDICLQAEKRGLRNYVVPCFAIHNSNGIKNLPLAFWKACLHVRRKWRDRLPIHSPCVSITWFPLNPAKLMLWRFVRYTVRGHRGGTRVPNPALLHQQLQSEGKIPRLKESVSS